MSGMGIIREQVETLGGNLAWWDHRSDDLGRAQTAVRRAGMDAVAAIDVTLAELHAIRSRLVSEIAQARKADAARVDALLARSRSGQTS